MKCRIPIFYTLIWTGSENKKELSYFIVNGKLKWLKRESRLNQYCPKHLTNQFKHTGYIHSIYSRVRIHTNSTKASEKKTRFTIARKLLKILQLKSTSSKDAGLKHKRSKPSKALSFLVIVMMFYGIYFNIIYLYIIFKWFCVQGSALFDTVNFDLKKFRASLTLLFSQLRSLFQSFSKWNEIRISSFVFIVSFKLTRIV